MTCEGRRASMAAPSTSTRAAPPPIHAIVGTADAPEGADGASDAGAGGVGFFLRFVVEDFGFAASCTTVVVSSVAAGMIVSHGIAAAP